MSDKRDAGKSAGAATEAGQQAEESRLSVDLPVDEHIEEEVSASGKRVRARGVEASEVKEGRGGIRDIEFLVQGMQLRELPRDAALVIVALGTALILIGNTSCRADIPSTHTVYQRTTKD